MLKFECKISDLLMKWLCNLKIYIIQIKPTTSVQQMKKLIFEQHLLKVDFSEIKNASAYFNGSR